MSKPIDLAAQMQSLLPGAGEDKPPARFGNVDIDPAAEQSQCDPLVWVPDDGEGIPEQPPIDVPTPEEGHIYQSLMTGAQVRAVRDVLNLTAREMASLMGTSTRTLQRMSVPSALLSTPMVRTLSELVREIDALRELISTMARVQGNIQLHRHGWRQLPESGRWIPEALWVQLVGEVWRAEVVAAGGIEHVPWSPVMELD